MKTYDYAINIIITNKKSLDFLKIGANSLNVNPKIKEISELVAFFIKYAFALATIKEFLRVQKKVVNTNFLLTTQKNK